MIHFFVLFLMVVCMDAWGHGFGQYTYVKTTQGWESIQQVAEGALQEKQQVICCDVTNLSSPKSVSRAVAASGMSETNCYFRICFDSCINDDILCTPTQEFYLPLINEWVSAYKLQVGDVLLSECAVQKPIAHIELVKEPLSVYTLEIEESHTFLVGCSSILTHNIVLPLAFTAGFMVPFGAGAAAGGSAGGFFGPVTFIGGCLVGGVIGLAVKTMCKRHEPPGYELTFNTNDLDTYRTGSGPKDMGTDAQAPGKPTEKEGYAPPKNWNGEKTKAPKNGKFGWPDENGNVWVPTGPGDHGGPHWDVQKPNGDYDNVYPGGKIRPGRR